MNLKLEQWKDSDSLEHIQNRKLKTILASARKTKYYKNILTSSNDFVLEELPIIEKDDIRRDVDSFISSGFRKESLRTIKTSGSTGTPLRILMDWDCSSYRKALLFFVSTERGRSPFDIMALMVSHGEYHKPIMSSTAGLYRNLSLHTSADEAESLSAIRSRGANILSAYPSTVEMMARINGRDKAPMKLKHIACGGEILTPGCRKDIQESFSCPVFNIYNAWEFGSVAWECPEEHSLHVNSGSCILEIVDSKGKPKKSGVGEVVITGLQNKAMPLLRYRIGDLASWGKECPCGRGLPVLKTLVGRSDDLIILPSGKARPAFSMNISIIDGIISGTWMHQLVQEREDLFVFRFVPCGKGVDEGSKKEIREKIAGACFGEKINVEFEEVSSISKGKTGKIQRVVSKVRRPRHD